MPSAVAMPLYIQEAERLGHNAIGCEHLLLGMLADEDGVAAKVLAAHGITLDVTRRQIAEMTGDGWRDAVRWRHSPRATVVRRLAELEAERLEQPPCNAHLLLAMLTEGGGLPMRVLAELDVDVAQLRDDLLTALDVREDLRSLYLRQRQAYEHAQQKARAQAQQPDYEQGTAADVRAGRGGSHRGRAFTGAVPLEVREWDEGQPSR